MNYTLKELVGALRPRFTLLVGQSKHGGSVTTGLCGKKVCRRNRHGVSCWPSWIRPIRFFPSGCFGRSLLTSSWRTG